MFDSNCSIDIVAVVYQCDADNENPRYIQVDAAFSNCNVRRETFYLPYKKFNLKPIKKMCP